MALQQLCGDRSQTSDDESPWPQKKSRVDCSITIEGLEHLWNQCCRTKEPDPEDEEKATGDREVPIAEQSEINDRLLYVQLPHDGAHPAQHCDENHRYDEVASKPVVDLAPIERDLECTGGQRDEHDSDCVDRHSTGGLGSHALLSKAVGVVN